MIYNFFSKADNVIQSVRILISISLLISSIQQIYNRKFFNADGLLPWHILRQRRKFTYFQAGVFNVIYSKNGITSLNFLRILLLIFFLFEGNRFAFLTLILLTICNYLIFFRSSLMNNAADQVNNIVLIGLIVSHIFNGTISDYLIIYFFSLLLIISYFTSGLLKCHEKKWQSGFYLKRVLLTRNFGNSFYLSKINWVDKKAYKIFSLTTIWWQLLSITTPFLPPQLLLIYLMIGLFFHISTGVLMGLHNFIWTFTGLLPAIIFLNSKVYCSF